MSSQTVQQMPPINEVVLNHLSCIDRPSAQTRLLEQELSAAREEAAAATAHMKQFQTLATSSDQALRDMQVRRSVFCTFMRACRCTIQLSSMQTRHHRCVIDRSAISRE